MTALFALLQKCTSAVAGELSLINKHLMEKTKPAPVCTGHDNHWFATLRNHIVETATQTILCYPNTRKS